MNRLVAALLAAASCASIAQAQTVPDTPPGVSSTAPMLTLDRAIAVAEGASPTIDLAESERRIAAAGRTVAGLRPNPSVSVETENVFGTGSYAGVQALETTGSLSLPIELGGKRSARIAVADAQSTRAAVQSAILRADLRLGVTEAYVETIAAERRLVTARDQARIAGEALRGADVRVRAGRASPLEMQRADVARINADAALERAERQVEVSRFRLAQRIGQPVTAPLDQAWFDRVSGGIGPLARIGGGGTLALAAADADLATADARVRLARSQRLPDLSVSAGARRFENGDAAFLFSLSVPLPVFNNGRAAIQQAGAERSRSEAQRRVTVIEVEDAIARAQAEAANAATTAAAANGPALAAAREAARIARIGYREGKFGQLDLLDAERTLADTRAAAIDALAAYHNAQARLRRLTTPAPTLGDIQ